MWKKLKENPIKALTAATAFIVASTTLISMLSSVALKLSQPAEDNRTHVGEKKRILIEMDARIDSLNNIREKFIAGGAK